MPSLLTWNLGYCDERFGPWPTRRQLVEAELARGAHELALFQAVERTRDRVDAMTEFAAVFPDARRSEFVAASGEPGREVGCGVLSWVPLRALRRLRLSTVAGADDDRSERVVVAVEIGEAGYEMWIANAHFSWVEAQARSNVAETLEWLSALEGPKVLAGDMNNEPSSDVFTPLRRAGWVDAWEALRPGEDGRTFLENGRLVKRIDHAWVSPEAEPLLRAVDRVGMEAAPDGLRVSDHFGLALRLA